MKEIIRIEDYANLLTEKLARGILLNTSGEKFNSMVIGWGHLGRLWSRPTYNIYVRRSRYTKAQLDRTGEFTISAPLNDPDPLISRICGSESGYRIDKTEAAGLLLESPLKNSTPGIRQYPLTLECRVLYSQEQDLERIPGDILHASYPQNVPGTFPMANRDPHTMYVGEILAAYIIREG